jgi:calcineurin-like phosphoesterase family protein
MNNVLINNWNSVVKDTDEVFLLGDFCFGNKEQVESCFRQLKGNIHLVKGNHDRFSNTFYKDLFSSYHQSKMYLTNNIVNDIMLSHKPIVSESIFKNYNLSRGSYEVVSDKHYDSIKLSIYGHVHDTHILSKPEFLTKHFCVSAEAINYTPILLQEILK